MNDETRSFLDRILSPPTKTMTEVRLVWKIGPFEGGGSWVWSGIRPVLEAHRALSNFRYGHGTHWIEERVA